MAGCVGLAAIVAVVTGKGADDGQEKNRNRDAGN